MQNGGLNSGSPNPAPKAKIGSLREETSRALAQASPAKALLPRYGLELVRGGQRVGQTIGTSSCLLVLAVLMWTWLLAVAMKPVHTGSDTPADELANA